MINSNDETLLDELEALKSALICVVKHVGTDFDDGRYRWVRARILEDRRFSQLAGGWLVDATTLEEAYVLIRREAADSKDSFRAHEIIYDGLNPVLAAIREGTYDGTASQGPRAEALNRLVSDLEQFQVDWDAYWSDLEPQSVYDNVLNGKVRTLESFCSLLGWVDLVNQLKEIMPLQGNAAQALELTRGFVIPEIRHRLMSGGIVDPNVAAMNSKTPENEGNVIRAAQPADQHKAGNPSWTQKWPPRVFICYSHRDKKWMERLQVFLKPLEKEGLIDTWDDTRIDPGGKWRSQIKSAIESSFAAVLLISADFLASDFISSNELPLLLSSSKENGLLILPVIVGPCGFARHKDLSSYKAVNPSLKPLIDMRKGEQEKLWDRVEQSIRAARPSAPEVAAGPQASGTSPQISLPSYDESRYRIDKTGASPDASILDGAILYRLAPLEHSGREEILSGFDMLFSRDIGRFNHPQQRAIYCSNNLLICIAEALYEMYHYTCLAILSRQTAADIQKYLSSEVAIAAFTVREIGNLVWLGANNLTPTLLTISDRTVARLLDMSNQLRSQEKNGILYPSARHSRGLSLVLFQDATNKLYRESYQTLHLRLQLVPESPTSIASPPELPRLAEQIIDATRGYYSFSDPKLFAAMQGGGALNPDGLPPSGFVDFVRRQYASYPYDAVAVTQELSKPCPLSLPTCPYAKAD